MTRKASSKARGVRCKCGHEKQSHGTYCWGLVPFGWTGNCYCKGYTSALPRKSRKQRRGK